MNALTITGLTYRYPSGAAALDGVNLEIPAGSKTALVGKNGSGKSTLLLHINGLLDGEGSIEVMGITRHRKTMPLIREKTGLLFGQTEYHFIMTDLLRDVMLGVPGRLTPRQKRDRAMEWLTRFGLDRYASTSPLDLSAGEMKRAALAGVLAKEPELLVLDEPLSGLDRRSAAGLIDILKSIDTTMIIATHRLYLVKNLATHVAHMDKGRITGLYTAAAGLKRKEIRDLLF